MSDLERSTPLSMRPDAWLVPEILDVKGAKRTSLRPDQVEEVHGTVAWGAEIFCDSQGIGVTDKFGVTHYPKPLFVQSEKRRTVWEVAGRTTSLLFGSKELAYAYLSSFPASVSGGLAVTEREVNG